MTEVANMARGKKAVTIGNTNFPLYSIRVIGERHFLVAGGGGQAKTGISNAFEVFELRLSDGFVIADKVLRYETGPHAIMNSCVVADGSNYILAAGMEDHTHIYNLKYKVVKKKEGLSNVDGIRKRKGNLTRSEDHNAAPSMVTFEVAPGAKVQTDFHKEGGFQKVVAFTPDKTIMATGGADGKIRCWQYPSLKKLREIKAHKDDIDDLDFHPRGKHIASVSRDGHGYIWNTAQGNMLLEILMKHKTEGKYRLRNCRYGIVVDKKEENLYTTHIPVVRGRNPQACFITKWDTTGYAPTKTQKAGLEILSSLAVSDNGIYLGVGSISGSVSVFITFSLQRLYHIPEAHSIFVTGLEFIPSSESSRIVTGNQDFSLLSISADNSVKLHQAPQRTLYSPFWAVAGMLVIIYLLFWLVAALGL